MTRVATRWLRYIRLAVGESSQRLLSPAGDGVMILVDIHTHSPVNSRGYRG